MTAGLVIMWCITAFFIGIIVSNLIDVFITWHKLRKEEKHKRDVQQFIDIMTQAGVRYDAEKKIMYFTGKQ